MKTDTLDLGLPSQSSDVSGRAGRWLDDNFVLVASLVSLGMHFAILFALKKEPAPFVPPEPAKVVAKVRIFANPNGNPNSVAKAVEVAKPKPLPKPKPRPDQKVISTAPVTEVASETPAVDAGPQSFGDDVTGGVVGEGFSTTDGESEAGITANAEPIERIEPNFPSEAQAQGIEGWVLLRFDISEEGKAEKIEVIGAQPRNLFEREAKTAVKKWKYSPRLVAGVPTKIIGKEVRFEFKLPPS